MTADFFQLGLGRWIHVMAGVLWVGLLYYFNFVQADALKAAQADGTAAGITKHVAPRALFFFRWAAVVTWGAGFFMLWQRGWLPGALTLQGSLAPLGVGVYIGTLMLANLWLVLWPHQKKVLGLVPASIEERLRCSRITHLSSRTNTMLSVPLLFFMAAGSHGGHLFGA